jgi:hypothetical protein
MTEIISCKPRENYLENVEKVAIKMVELAGGESMGGRSGSKLRNRFLRKMPCK